MQRQNSETHPEQQNKKKVKKCDDNLRMNGTIADSLTFTLYGSQKEKRERKGQKSYLKK